MLPCMAGAITTGSPAPIAVVAKIETSVSGMACAIFPMVLAVHGAISSRSAALPLLLSPTSPQYSTHETLPVHCVIGCRPVAHSIASGWMIRCADSVITACTTAPRRTSSCASSIVRTAAMLPVIPSTIILPASVSGRAPSPAVISIGSACSVCFINNIQVLPLS